jgi:hypothetical protein
MLAHASQRDWIFGDDSPQTILTDAYESGVAEAQAFPNHLAAALRNIIARGRHEPPASARRGAHV